MITDIYQPYDPASKEIPEYFAVIPYMTSLRIEKLMSLFATQDITPTGSRHIEYPPKENTDDDYLIFVPDSIGAMDTIRENLVTEGWFDCLEGTSEEAKERYKEELYPLHLWGAFRKGEVNIIVYTEKELYDRSKQATVLCTKLNVKDKERRIRIFRWYKFNETLLQDDLSFKIDDNAIPWEKD